VIALRALGAWTGPALLATVVAAVAAGAGAAPLLVLATVIAPLLALLQPPRPAAPAHPALLGIVAVVAALVLWAHLLILADLAALLGAQRWHGAVFAASLALLLTLGSGAERWRGALLLSGAAALLLVLLAGAGAAHLSPWAAWEQAAARSALVFGGGSAWVTDGARFVRRSTVAFDEGHRVVALEAGTFRVVEQDGARRVVRDWRLAAGDALTLRPGDTLTAEAGSRVRFEAGKRVPGAAASGAAWAEGGARGQSPGALGVVATLALGALALVPAGDRRAIPGAAVATALGIGAAAWGVYVTLVAPEAGLAGSPAGALLGLARSGVIGVRGVSTLLLAMALLALFVAAAAALRDRLAAASARRAPAVWTAVVAIAAVAALTPADPWLPLLAGLGLAGAALAAPRLAAGAAARIGPWPAEIVGGIVGALAFVGLIALAVRWTGAFPVSIEAPAVMAALMTWIVVKFLRSEAPTAS
jgi:hypothetical protein